VQADAELTFPEGGPSKADAQSQYSKKPEIKVTIGFCFYNLFSSCLEIEFGKHCQ
jgi:hypothetical protein